MRVGISGGGFDRNAVRIYDDAYFIVTVNDCTRYSEVREGYINRYGGLRRNVDKMVVYRRI
jgi:hypothetical protein